MYKVVIIEDEDMIRKGLIYSVQWQDMDCCVVGEATNGLEGAELIREKRPDIALIDINMPVMTGLEMLKLTASVSCANIILSGYPEFEFARQAIALGVVAYLLKPIDRGELQKAVELAKAHLSMQKLYITKQEQAAELNGLDPIEAYRPDDSMEESLVGDITAYIEEHFGEKLVMRDLVEAFHYSETFLNNKFKAVTGITFNNYLNRYRVRQAIGMMRENRLSLEKIAELCGFSQYKYFARVFEKYMGCSPRYYMKMTEGLEKNTT